MKTIVQFLQQLGPQNQDISNVLENLMALTGHEVSANDTEERSDLKEALKESLNTI